MVGAACDEEELAELEADRVLLVPNVEVDSVENIELLKRVVRVIPSLDDAWVECKTDDCCCEVVDPVGIAEVEFMILVVLLMFVEVDDTSSSKKLEG